MAPRTYSEQNTPSAYLLRGIVEFIGTFIFLTVIFVTAGLSQAAWGIGLALAVVILFGGYISGGHFNPAVSIMFSAAGKLGYVDLMIYIIAQVLGGLAAWGFASSSQKTGYTLPNSV
jgi:aquaporin Z